MVAIVTRSEKAVLCHVSSGGEWVHNHIHIHYPNEEDTYKHCFIIALMLTHAKQEDKVVELAFSHSPEAGLADFVLQNLN